MNTIIRNGSIFVVRYRLISQKHLPIHYYYEDLAKEFDGRIGLVLEKIKSKINREIYRCLVGSNDIKLGKGWIKVIDTSLDL